MCTIPNMQQILKRQRQIVREMTKSVKKYKSDRASVQTSKYCIARIAILQNLWREFKANHTSLLSEEDTGQEDVNDYLESDTYNDLEDLYLTTVAELEEQNERLAKPLLVDQDEQDEESSTSKESLDLSGDLENVNKDNVKQEKLSDVKLPKVTIPAFSGEYQEWMAFKDLYEDMIHRNANLSTMKKFHYLRTSLTGKAAKLIQRYALTIDNYEVAWRELKRRYDNTKVLIDAQLETIFSLPSVKYENAADISDLIDTVNHSLETLQQLTEGFSMDQPMIVFWVRKCLPPETRKLWEDKTSPNLNYSTWVELRTFLEHRFRALEALSPNKGKTDMHANAKDTHKDGKGKLQHANHVSHVSTCTLCSEQHQIWRCNKFIALPIAAKKTTVKEKGLCWNCLSAGHLASKCPSSRKCRICDQRHHSLLHVGGPSYNSRAGQVQAGSESNPIANAIHVEKSQTALVTAGTVTSRHRTVLLPTVLINAVGPNRSELTCRALIDQGSQSSFVTEHVVQQLRLMRHRSHVEFVGVGSSEIRRSKYQVSLNIKAKDQYIPVSAQVLKNLTGILPGRLVEIDHMDYLHGIELADPQWFEPGRIDMLLGADVYAFIIMEGLRTGPRGSPVAQQTRLGWILSGEIIHSSSHANSGNQQVPASSQAVVAFTRTNLDSDLKKFWELEEIPTSVTLTEEDQQCEDLYTSTTKRTEEGRYEIRLPWRRQHHLLGTGREAALRRLLQLERRFQRDHELKIKYIDEMHNYVAEGHVEHVSMVSCPSGSSSPHQQLPAETLVTYLPHQPVLKRVNGELKIRVVFDASQITETGVSLNDVLLTGPTLQNEVPKVILRWRIYQFAFTADVQGMYRQIQVAPEDRDVQRFLWRNDLADEVQEWRLTRVVFGMAPAPYLALRTIQQVIKDYASSYPLAADALLHDTYVDDIFSGADTINEAVKKKHQLVAMLKQGRFELHKWMANNRAILDERQSGNQQSIPSFLPTSFSTVKALGVNWDPEEDVFKYCIELPDREVHTKRSLLSDLFKIYDPLGWIGPTVIQAKIILQEIWLRGLGWDEELPQDLALRWNQFRESLNTLGMVRIPRWIGVESTQTLYVHGFCDASLVAYGAAVYVRAGTASISERSTLLISRSRVAPIKTVTLPRLELCGAVLLARLLRYVTETFPNAVIEGAWTDSTIVLAWIRKRPRSWKMFVANRVGDIHDKVGADVWKHVPTESNPADCLSRGLELQKLIEHKLWWAGPEWLNLPCSEWPQQGDVGEVHLEEKISHTANVIVTDEQDNSLELRYSSLSRLLRITAYCLRFIRSVRVGFPQPEVSKELHTKEIQEALWTWIRNIQKRAFATERTCIESKKPLPSRSPILSLNPFLDEDGLLRVGGRLRNAELTFQQKYPVILPKSGHIITLIIRETHENTLHGGATLMLGMLRRRYWVLRARNAVKQCIHRCVVCRRYRHPEATQLMGDLPTPRVQVSRPFAHTGVDYCGPFDVRLRNKDRHVGKTYVAIFICFATKAIHLEVAMDLSSEAFIAAFRRFTARRGLCTDMYSDRGTNFVGADQQLRQEHQIFEKQIQPALSRELAIRGITWHFNPPAAPHFGGLWEAGVKSFKYHLRRVMGRASLSLEEFHTAVVQIEGCLNSRPMSPLSDDPEDVDAFTPGHFIVAGPPLAHPEPTLLKFSTGKLARWQLTQRLVQGFWSKWSTEYMSRLQQRPKWQRRQDNLKANDLVLVREPNLPPARWRLARIAEVHPGKDGLVRVLTLRTGTAVFQRPAVQVCPLFDS